MFTEASAPASVISATTCVCAVDTKSVVSENAADPNCSVGSVAPTTLNVTK